MVRLRIALVSLALTVAAAAAPAQTTLERIAGRQQLTVGYSANSAPFSFLSGGAPAGYAVDLCTEIAERVQQRVGRPGFRVLWSRVDQDRFERLVEGRAVDLMCAGVSDTPARRKLMAFSEPIFLSSVKLLVRRDGGPQAVAALQGRTVAVLGRTTAETAVNQLNAQNGMAIKLSRVVSSEAALSQLRLRQADAWARDEVLLLGAVARESDAASFTVLDEVLASEPIAIAMPRDEELRRLVNDSLAEAVRSGRLQALYDKWFVQPNAASAAGLNLPLSPALKAKLEAMR